MIQTSVIVPHRNSADLVAEQLPSLSEVLDALDEPYEVVIADDGSDEDAVDSLRGLLQQYDWLRVVQTGRPLGLSAAITAALMSAWGQTVVMIDAARKTPEDIPNMINGLARWDMVYSRSRDESIWKGIARTPRRLLLGLDVHNPHASLWAARAEALAGIELARGMYRYLPTLVEMRGFRVGEIRLESNRPALKLSDGLPNPGDLLFTWWLRRRWRQFTSHELLAGDGSQTTFPIGRFDDESHGVDHRQSA